MLSTEEESTFESCVISDTDRTFNYSSIIIDELSQSAGISQEQPSWSVSSSTPNKKRNNSFNKIKRE